MEPDWGDVRDRLLDLNLKQLNQSRRSSPAALAARPPKVRR